MVNNHVKHRTKFNRYTLSFCIENNDAIVVHNIFLREDLGRGIFALRNLSVLVSPWFSSLHRLPWEKFTNFKKHLIGYKLIKDIYKYLINRIVLCLISILSCVSEIISPREYESLLDRVVAKKTWARILHIVKILGLFWPYLPLALFSSFYILFEHLTLSGICLRQYYPIHVSCVRS